jgi:hypothetical protein
VVGMLVNQGQVKTIRNVRCTFFIDQIVTFNLQKALKITCRVTP